MIIYLLFSNQNEKQSGSGLNGPSHFSNTFNWHLPVEEACIALRIRGPRTRYDQTKARINHKSPNSFSCIVQFKTAQIAPNVGLNYILSAFCEFGKAFDDNDLGIVVIIDFWANPTNSVLNSVLNGLSVVLRTEVGKCQTI